MTIVETTRPVTGGVDTHADVHVAAAVDANGGVLGVESAMQQVGATARVQWWTRHPQTLPVTALEPRRRALICRRSGSNAWRSP
jgi:hypothetical protein